MSRETLEAHVQGERERPITLEDVQTLIRSPHEIYEDGRRVSNAKGRYFALRLKSDPHGAVKVKRLIAHLKRCRKLMVFEVSFISTVLLAKKLPPQAKLLWRSGTITS